VAAPTLMTSPSPAWYPDPHDPARIRWWDGQTWTENVRDRPAAAPPPAAPAWPDQDLAGASTDPSAGAQPVPAAASAPVGTLEPPLPPLPSIEPLPPFPGVDASPPQPAYPAQAAEPAFPVAAAPTEIKAPDLEWPVGPVAPVEPAAPATPQPQPQPQPLKADFPTAPPAQQVAPPGATSLGAALLPPLPAAAPPGGRFNEPPTSMFDPDKPVRSAPLRVALLAGVVVVALVLGVGLYTTGALDSLIGKSGRQPSSSSVEVVEGDGYSFERPTDWAQTEPPNSNVDLAFASPNGVALGVSRANDEAAADFSNAAVRQVAFDAMVRVQQALVPGAQVVSRTPITLDGAPGERVQLSGALPSGESFSMIEIVALHGQNPYVMVLGGTPEAIGDPTVVSQFDQIVASFLFD